jgi:hypothetical protein
MFCCFEKKTLNFVKPHFIILVLKAFDVYGSIEIPSFGATIGNPCCCLHLLSECEASKLEANFLSKTTTLLSSPL